MRLRLLPPLLLTLLVTTLNLHASKLHGGRVYADPPSAYLNQSFTINFELELSPGTEVEDLRISGFPNDPELLSMGRLQTAAAQRRSTRRGEATEILSFTATARGLKPHTETYHPRVECVLVQKRSIGFFTSRQAVTREMRLPPFNLDIKELPTTNQPTDFSGAVGTFTLQGEISQTSVQPGDIITLNLSLTGKGWLGDATMPQPPPDQRFKNYPPREKLREATTLRSEQVWIPQTTNAAAIPAATFTYFDPHTATYESCQAGPFKLHFTTPERATTDEELRVIAPSARTTSPTSDPPSITVSVTHINQRARQLLPLLTLAATLLLAGFIFFRLRILHFRLRLLAALLILATGATITYKLRNYSPTTNQLHTTRATGVYFAPSDTSPLLFRLNKGEPVTPLETTPTWIRIDSNNRRGWLPTTTLSE